MRQERISLTRDELKRVKVLERVASGSMTNAEAAASLGVTTRQLRRLKANYKRAVEQELIHGNRGRKPVHVLSEEFKQEVLLLYGEKYHGSNFSHYSELLEEREGIKISPSSVGRVLKLSCLVWSGLEVLEDVSS
jgi:transposase